MKQEQPTSESRSTLQKIAVIEIGTTAIRAVVAEGTSQAEVETLDSLTQPVSLGTDTYTTGRISRKTIENCVSVMLSYKEKMREYRIDNVDRVRVVATSAVREADNTLGFIDRIQIATGWEVDVLDVAEVHRIIYQSIQSSKEKIAGLGQDRWLVAEVGGGNTEFLLMQHGEIETSNAVRLGSIRLQTMLKKYNTPQAQWSRMMQSHAHRALVETRILKVDTPVKLLMLGGDMRIFASRYQQEQTSGSETRFKVSDLEQFTEHVLSENADELVREFHIALPDAETLGPALVANLELAHLLKVNSFHVLPVSLRDGLVRETIDQNVWSDELVHQIVNSAIDVGRKFQFDEAHARHSARIAKSLFNQLQPLHGLSKRFELLLVLATLLHEIGTFIGTSSYHKHSMYLISNSELFGLSRKQLALIGLVARYHRRASPKASHSGFANLSRKDRLVVIKLAALLRVAISLDTSRSQRVHDFACFVDRKQVILSVSEINDLSMEQMAIQQNGGLFEDTFGMQINLRVTKEQSRY